MIIIVRGNHGSGKSTVVRNVWTQLLPIPIFGALGPAKPEAYRCINRKQARYTIARELFILGPYEGPATAGADYLTKKGVQEFLRILERYRLLGDMLLESVLVSARFSAPTVGAWLEQHKKSVVCLTLKTTPEECQDAIAKRQQTSINEAHESKHFIAQQRMVDRVTSQLTEKGFRMEYASREEAPNKILNWLR